jgi:uncharacterized membrane protein
MKDKILNRRSFFLYLIAVIVCLYSIFTWTTTKKNKKILSKSLDTSPDILNTHVIGQEYLKKFPKEKDPEILNSLIFDRPDEAYNSKNDLHRFILEKVKKDFQEDRIVKIRGWILSRTESRLCALAGLLNKDLKSLLIVKKT